MKKLETCNDVYNLPCYYETTKIENYLLGFYYNHIKELNIDTFVISGHPDIINSKVIIKVHMNFARDFRRIWRLCSVWYKDEDGLEKPFMVIQNAGREGDDYYYRIISDKEVFCKALTYLSEIIRQKLSIEEFNNYEIPFKVENIIMVDEEGDEDTLVCSPDEKVTLKEIVAIHLIRNNRKCVFKSSYIGNFYGQEYFTTFQGTSDWCEEGEIVTSDSINLYQLFVKGMKENES